MTGPILPFFVESKVEQYLKIIFLHFLDFNHSKALTLSEIAFFIGIVLVLRAITTALYLFNFILLSGTPEYMPTDIPAFFKLFAISEEPVKSSPITPRSILTSLVLFN